MQYPYDKINIGGKLTNRVVTPQMRSTYNMYNVNKKVNNYRPGQSVGVEVIGDLKNQCNCSDPEIS